MLWIVGKWRKLIKDVRWPGCVWVSSLLAYPGSRGPMAVKWLCVCVCSDSFKSNIKFIHYLNNSAKSQINKAKLAEIPYNGGGETSRPEEAYISRCTSAVSLKYNWMICVWQHCGLMSHYSDHQHFLLLWAEHWNLVLADLWSMCYKHHLCDGSWR